jgi:hypothetical protein
MTTDTLGLVESPAQFLHLLEWCYAEGASDRTTAIVLAPQQTHAIAQLRELAAFAAEEGVEVEWREPRRSAAAFAGTVRALWGPVGKARRLVIGDPFSGLIQTLLPAARAQQLIVVDDGTATMEFAAQYAGTDALRRWDSRPSMLDLPRSVLGRQARRTLAGGKLRLFTVMPITGVPASRIQRNHYAWLHGRFGPPRVVAGVDVIGSSLVESGVADRAAYLNRVVALARSSTVPGRYFAHRREDPEKLAELSLASGLRVVRPRLPLEIELRRGPISARVVSFPSSVGYTLPVVLGGLPIEYQFEAVPEEMLGGDVSQRAREFLDKISSDLRHGARLWPAGDVAPLSASA